MIFNSMLLKFKILKLEAIKLVVLAIGLFSFFALAQIPISKASMTIPLMTKVPTKAVNTTRLFVAGAWDPRLELLDAIRLESALGQLAPPENTFWLGATFANIAAQERVDAKRALVFNQLQQLARFWRADVLRHEAVVSLIEQLSQLKFVSRVFFSIDPDAVRLNPKHNPLLAGEVKFYFPTRPQSVAVLGLVEQRQTLTYVPGMLARDYLAKLNVSPLAKRSTLTTIQPDGQRVQTNIGYWLKQTHFIAPGATLWVEFASLPKGFIDLNRQIADLLRYQQPWWEPYDD
jgi:hypothetical protein